MSPRAIVDWWRSLGDWRFPLSVLPIAVQELVVRAPDNFPGSDIVGVSFVVIALASLRWVRQYSQAVFVFLLGVTSTYEAAFYGFAHQPPFTPGIAIVFAIFCLEAYDASHRAHAMLVAFASLLLIYCVAQQVDGRVASGDIWGQWVLYGLALGAGVIVRHRREDGERLAARAGEVERTRDERVRQAASDERARIARELHDVIAHSVSVIVIQAGVHRREVADPATREVLGSIELTGRQALGELRRLLGILRHDGDAAALAPQPGLRDLCELADRVREAGVEVDLDLPDEIEPPAPGVALSAYRIVQEALTNVLKHSGATRVRVSVDRRASALELSVVDNGHADGHVSIGSGHGLVGMRERVSVYGGEVEAGPVPDGGFRVWARLPVEVTQR
jgi:signal transduction histidine kinase